MQWSVIILVALLIIIAAVVLIVKKQKSVNSDYYFDHDKFIIKGKKNKFIVNKNGCYEFLVLNGQIVACRDKSKSPEFIYYRGEQ